MIEDIRRKNMLTLLSECGGLARLARRIERSPSQVSQLVYGLKSSKTGRPRGMRSETARRIEKMTGKSFGWLDLANTPNTNGERSTIKTEATKYLSTEEEKLIRGIFEDARNQVIDLLIRSRKKSSEPEHPRDPRLDLL